jgi:hypothetical protein
VLGAIDVGVVEVGVALVGLLEVGILVGTPVGILVDGDLVTTNAQHRHQREDAIDRCSSGSCSSTQAKESEIEREREREREREKERDQREKGACCASLRKEQDGT